MDNNTPTQDPFASEIPPEISTSQPAVEPLAADRRTRRSSGSGAWIGGVALLIVGVYLLMQNLGMVMLNNWWALFILIPAAGAFGNAWRAYQNSGGQLTNAVSSSLFGGLILTMIAAIFLLNLSWDWFGPMVLILLGAGLLWNNYRTK